jgi:hypothetical protein
MNTPSQTAVRDACWSLGSALDFECEIEKAKSRADDALKSEGEMLCKTLACRALEDLPKRKVFLEWLRLRRAESPELAGTEIDRTFRSGRAWMWIAGGLLGGGSAGGYLHYLGREPVNVFWFLFWLVAFPLFLSALAVFLALATREHTGPGGIGRRIFDQLFRCRGQKRRDWDAWAGVIERHGKRFFPLAKWPLLGLTQRFACAFGIGALLALWVRLVFTDIAFGWESTVGWSPESWHAAARFLAAPWIWAFPSGVPTPEQMRASQFTHAGGISALDPAATRAWWPFLLGSLAVYSVALRGLFIALLGWNGRRALNLFADCLDGEKHSGANDLFRRLAGPLMAAAVQPASGALPAGRAHPAQPREAKSWLVLLSGEAAIGDLALHAAIAGSLGGKVSGIERVEIDHASANGPVLHAVRSSPDHVAVWIPSATDPIEGIRKTLEQIAIACSGRPWVVLLHGDRARLPLWQRWSDATRLDLDLVSWPST